MNRIQRLIGLLISLTISMHCHGEAVFSNITEDEARSLAKEAYIFSYPLVMNYRTMYLQAIDPDSKSYSGGFGKWTIYGNPATPDDKDVVTPNIDTPYSWVWLDLRAEPWVITLPKVAGTRYYSAQVDDLWGFVLDSPGSVKDGNDGGSYLLADASWQGEKPDGIKRVIYGESNFLGVLTRTEFLGGNDLAQVHKIQQEYTVQPLSRFLGLPSPPPSSSIAWPKWVEGSQNNENIFKYVNFILPYTLPNPADKATLERIAKIGIKGGQIWQPEQLKPAIRKAIQQGIADAIKVLDDNAMKSKNSLQFFSSRQTFDHSYLNRSVGVYAGMFGNLPDEAFYLPWSADANNHYLDGSKHDYTLTFPKNGTPPVHYFWSITLYSLPDHFLVANAMNRYSIGSRTPQLKKSPDGSLTLYFQKNAPDEKNKSNWLPTPNGPFYLVLRTYGPNQAILNGQWQLPKIEVAH